MKKLWKNVIRKSKIEIAQFLVAVLAVIASVTILLLNFWGIFTTSDSQILNISIILLDLLISSSLIERYGILEDLDEKCSTRDETSAYLTTRRLFDHTHPVEELWDGASEVCILAIANTSFLRGSGITRLQEAARKGVKINLLSIDPSSALAKEYETSHILSSISIPLEDNLKSYKQYCKRYKNFRKNVTLKVCNIMIPYSMMIVKKGDLVKHIKIDLYSTGVEYIDRRSIVIPSTDIVNIEFFLAQWNALWGDPQTIIIEE